MKMESECLVRTDDARELQENHLVQASDPS